MRRLIHRLAVLAVLLDCAAAGGGETALVVIVHPERQVRLTIEEVRAIYLKQKILWGDGSAITVLNREAGTQARESFSRRVIGRGSEALASYWNERYIEGILPPPTLASDQAVLRYVAANRNAVGYLAASTADGSVRIAIELDPELSRTSPTSR